MGNEEQQLRRREWVLACSTPPTAQTSQIEQNQSPKSVTQKSVAKRVTSAVSFWGRLIGIRVVLIRRA